MNIETKTSTGTSSDIEYFAAIPPDEPDRLANEMINKITEYREWCDSLGLTSLWYKKMLNYYGNSMGGNSSQVVTRGGSEGELALLKVNDMRQLIQEQLVVVTSQRPAGIAKPINSDTKSLKSARIGTTVAEFYMSQGGFEQKFVTMAETALVVDEAFVDIFWDQTKGDPIAGDLNSGQFEMSGDGILRIHCPWNVARDPGSLVDTNRWFILTFKSNKFDLAKKYPKFNNEILNTGDDDLPEISLNRIPKGSDEIYIHLLVHDRTPAVPQGRYSLLIGNKIVLDMPLPYKDFPVVRLASADVIDGNMGYAPSNDVMALQELTDGLHSIIATNSITFGGVTIIAPMGSDIKQTDLAKGCRMFELPPDMVDKIIPLTLAKTAPEVFSYISLLDDKKGKALGSVSGILAQQAQQGASGNSMALIQTQAISYNSGTQRGYFRTLSTVMTIFIGVIAKFADTERVASIVGKSKSQGLKEFKYTGQDLAGISSIVYEVVNPMFQTYGGRLTAAQDLLKAGQIQSPKQYINLAATGQPEVLVQDDEANGMLILEENEWLMENKPFKALITQMHEDHIKSHESQITLESQGTDPDFVARVLAHIQEHIDLWQQASNTNPAILIATGQKILPPPPPPPGMIPPPGQGPLPPPQGHPPGAPPPQGPPPGAMNHLAGPSIKGKAPPEQPNLPNIAGTNQKPVIPGATDIS